MPWAMLVAGNGGNSKKKRRKHNSTDSAKSKNVEVNPKTIRDWLASDNDEYKRCYLKMNSKNVNLAIAYYALSISLSHSALLTLIHQF